MSISVVPISPTQVEPAATLLFGASNRSAEGHGLRAPFADAGEAIALLDRCIAGQELVLVAESGGAVVGLAAGRVRGEGATVGPFAVAAPGRGIGGALLDTMIDSLDGLGSTFIRCRCPGWSPAAFALLSSRGFAVVETCLDLERSVGECPPLPSSRGLEVRAFDGDRSVLEEILRADAMLVGLDRHAELEGDLAYVARRRSTTVGFMAKRSMGDRTVLGPALVVDPSDLSALVVASLAEVGNTAVARLSGSSQIAIHAMLARGFQVRESSFIMSHGAPPPTRSTQLYSQFPELY